MISAEAIAKAAEDMSVTRQKGRFMARGDGLLQFPVGKRIVSVGFGDLHYGSDETVEIAVFDENRNFITNNYIDCGGDQVTTVTEAEFTALLVKLSKEVK